MWAKFGTDNSEARSIVTFTETHDGFYIDVQLPRLDTTFERRFYLQRPAESAVLAAQPPHRSCAAGPESRRSNPPSIDLKAPCRDLSGGGIIEQSETRRTASRQLCQSAARHRFKSR